MEGQPIAQVAVDELDISPMCGYFRALIQGMLQTLEQGNWGDYKHAVITSDSRQILLRIINNEKNVFQVLVTTRETNPTESLEVMANTEAAIAAALYWL